MARSSAAGAFKPYTRPDFLRLDAGDATAHKAMRRKALRHGALRAMSGFAERFAKRAKPDICSLAEGLARESLAGRAFAPRSSSQTARPVSGPFLYSR